ncbi:PEPxxWA-CTERM sorting domain-containing protein [Phenylobacterium sp.]|uniref:PEPxxWA-CTERM sorting domain-containing protein n=1 Tax=Phenylobacterium sp. TaxID=1871053 RepID=UPI0012228E4A|nr:PEPxxWA-CTERM sorting domain-containing protein [Phenylobacterium sp.]THD58419.1 MAG: PEP-CTERM sorting domain-containing protein [Phenylobacterium sp.]
MSRVLNFTAAGIAALSLVAVASSAAADTVGSDSSAVRGTNLVWLQSGTTGGKLISGPKGSTTATNILTTFNFNTPDLLLSGIGAEFLLSATETGHAATGTGVNETQAYVDGSFSFKLNDATTSAADLAALNAICNGCTNLLTVTFHNAWIVGGKTGGNFLAQDGDTTNTPASDPTTVTFTSSFFGPTTDDFFSFALGATDGTTIGYKAGQSFGKFDSVGNGNFDATFVPEPASWALMIAGFGGAGVMLRRRRAVAFAAA